MTETNQDIFEDQSNKIASDIVNTDKESNDDIELKKMLNQKLGTEEMLEMEMKQHIEEVRNNLGIFSSWMNGCSERKNLYKDFCNDFSLDYRTKLFENICEFFKDENFITDDILFYWKYMTICILKINKKYNSRLKKLVFNFENKETNFKMVKEKYIFKCFINNKQLCFFKENGSDYYVS